MKKLSLKKGFTLIELLVVISIIGILAAIVLANLSKSRLKGNDAAVKTNMANISAEAEVYFDQHDNLYRENKAANATQSCSDAKTMFGDGSIRSAIAQIQKNAEAAPTCIVSADGTSWAVAAKLKGEQMNWCVDSDRYVGYGGILAGAACTVFDAQGNPL